VLDHKRNQVPIEKEKPPPKKAAMHSRGEKKKVQLFKDIKPSALIEKGTVLGRRGSMG